MMPLTLDHIQLAMPTGGEDQAREFWVNLIGLTESPKPKTLAGRGGVWFELGDGRGLHYGVEANFTPNKKAHPAFTTEHLDALANTLQAAECKVTWDDALAPRRRFYAEDPFGNRLEFLGC